MVFPYHSSKNESLTDHLLGVTGIETLPDETDDSAAISSAAKPPCIGGLTYLCVDWFEPPFTKIHQILHPWCKEKVWDITLCFAV